MSTQLTQYRGSLTAAKAAEGIALARSNASRLIADAECLLERGRYPSAIALAILAVEELGKVQVIKTIALHQDDASLKLAWKDYRSHRAKNVQWILPQLAAEGARTLEQVRAAADPKAEHTAMLDAIKQLAFYTDCFGDNARWSDPSDAIDPAFAESIIAVARVLNRDRVTTEREIELWATIVGPHYGRTSMVDALLSFQRQAFSEGLTDISPQAMEAFVSGQPIDVTGLIDPIA